MKLFRKNSTLQPHLKWLAELQDFSPKFSTRLFSTNQECGLLQRERQPQRTAPPVVIQRKDTRITPPVPIKRKDTRLTAGSIAETFPHADLVSK